MKIVKRILYILAGLLALLCGFVLVCAFRPDITDRISTFLYPDRGSAIRAEIADGEAAVSISGETKMDGIADMEAEDREGRAIDTEADRQGISGELVSDYVPPAPSELVIPENVSGKNGYRQVQDEQEQIGEEAAEQIQNSLDAGHTGDGLDFDARYYPYYAMLDEKGKHVYRQIYANADGLCAEFLPVEAVQPSELRNIFSAVVNDHPELFWLETAYAGKYVGAGQCVEIDLRFNRTAQELERAQADFQENALQILTGAQNLSGNYEKEKFVHDALVDRISYNLRAEMNQSAYSALAGGQTVCAGYARAFQYLLQQLGIPCYYCTGYAGESHAWNIVVLDDGCYNVDVTWDDTGSGTYDYFNKTDADYAKNHIRQELSVYLPACDGQSYRNLEPEQELEEEPEGESEWQQEQPEQGQEQPEQGQEQTEQGQEQTEQGQGQPEPDNGLRSLSDVGMREEQVIRDMQGYYADCYAQILQNGAGSYTFYNVIEGEALLNEWYQSYRNDDYKQAYMENAVTGIGASSYEFTLASEPLQGGRYLITHKVSFR